MCTMRSDDVCHIMYIFLARVSRTLQMSRVRRIPAFSTFSVFRAFLSLPFFVSLVMASFRLIFYTDRVMDPRERACELSTDYGICFVRASYGANSRTVAATAAALPSSLRRRRFPVLSFKRKRENATTRWENVSNRRERFAKIRGIKSAQSVE